ncbi:TBC1 domain family member 25 [Anguilla anguilla]|uniref:TBC1 domain family member 25 n=1 Tax=Anguilla anguilla TaxID=7936 RepID=UPI0015AA702B|nr:TBC1 domain family member 25 [Anguilla anguilla]
MAAEDEREVVRVRVKKCEGALPAESRSFAVDPLITSLDVLHHILIRAFELNRKCNFGVSYLCRDHGDSNHGEGEVYQSLLSDLDLDSAFARSAKPYLLLKMDIKPAEDSPLLEGWDIINPKDVISSDLLPGERRGLAAAALPFTQSLLSQVGRTLSRVQQALSWSSGEEGQPFKPPLSDSEFHSFLNSQGQLCHPEELRLRIYHGGVEPSLRKVVWRYLLNVYPDGLTGQERIDYMKRKSREYQRLKREWPARVAPGDLDLIRSSVTKDVRRTDRTHPYYAGSEDNPHLTALADLLTTYAVTHPQVSYCQGMSDLASPILVVMDDEAHAYVCFCGLMRRLEGNFAADGGAMALKFGHLRLLLERCDPELFAHLRRRGADGLLFCYRWLLLELKREFPFQHALRMLEVSWSSLPPDPPATELRLLAPPPDPPATELRLLAPPPDPPATELRLLAPPPDPPATELRLLAPPPDPPATELRLLAPPPDPPATELRLLAPPPDPLATELRLLAPPPDPPETERRLLAPPPEAGAMGCGPREEGVECRGRGEGEGGSLSGEPEESVAAHPPFEKQPSPGGFKYYSTHKEDGSELAPPPVSGRQSEESGDRAGDRERSSPKGHTGAALSSPSPPNTLAAPGFEHAPPAPVTDRAPPSRGGPSTPPPLPPPQELGQGNPFMLFLCVALLLEQRAQVMRSDLDHNELAMHFDRLVRRHSLAQVLQRARTLFAQYLQSQEWDSQPSGEVSPEGRPRPLQPPTGSASSNSTYRLTNTVPSTHPLPPPS